MSRNDVVIEARLLKRSALRHTPAGTPAINMVLGHRSRQTEAGGEREVRCDIEAVALGETALTIQSLRVNRMLRAQGFLAQRAVGDRKLLLHVTDAQAVTDGIQE